MTFFATITSKNQITLPKEVIEFLSLKKNRKVLIHFSKDEVVMKPMDVSVNELAGKYDGKAGGKINNSKKIREITKERVAEEIAREGK